MKIRDYRSSDKKSCLALFQSNVPEYFDIKDLEDFSSYLESHNQGNLVLENEAGEVVACGGYWIKGDTGRLSYGMVSREYHGQGIGAELVRARIAELSKKCSRIEIDTSQVTAGFYARFGFETVEVKRGAHGEGLDSVIMALDLKAVS